MVSVRLDALAELLCAELRGDGSFLVTGAQAIEKAGPTDVAFAGDEANLARLRNSRAGAVIVPRALANSPRLPQDGKPLLLVENASAAMVTVLKHIRPPRPRSDIGISTQAYVAKSARIGEQTNIFPGAFVGEDVVIGAGCDIHPGAVIGAGCRIGNDCQINPHVVLYHDVVLGNRVIVHGGAVIGADGYGYRLVNGRHEKIPHFGSVRIGDDVEIGANTTIDRAMIGETLISDGTKIDNLVMVAHNCEVGRHNLLVSQVGFAGSVTTGDYVVCAGQVGVADHVHLGERSVLAAQTGVSKNIPAGETWFGTPAMPAQLAMKVMMASQKLPQIREQLRQMQARLTELEQADSSTHREAA